MYTKKEQAYQREYKAKKRKLLDDLKKIPCMDCGGEFPPECMDFDHVRGEKVGSMSLIFNYSMDRILEEIEKCEIVCANCHRTRTRARNQYRPVTLT